MDLHRLPGIIHLNQFICNACRQCRDLPITARMEFLGAFFHLSFLRPVLRDTCICQTYAKMSPHLSEQHRRLSLELP